MIRLFRVSELLENIKITLSENFPALDVSGEISDVNINSKSGHIYFNLKEDKNVISCACWKNNALKLKSAIEEGKKVRIRGRVLSYPTNSKFYINVVNIIEEGEGDSNKKLIELKAKLTSEGIFLDIHKKPITRYPNSIGLITSSDGDVINDIKTTLQSTFPCKLYLYDVPVQGEQSVNKIIEAIEYFNALSENIPSFLIIARGGGSAEDLYHFNDEHLVRAVYKSRIPIISAIGHDPDSNLVDLVADRYVATPTASVAFLASRVELQENIKILNEHIKYILERNFSYYAKNLQSTTRLLKTPIDLINNAKERVFYLCSRSQQNLLRYLDRYQSSIFVLSSKLNNFPLIIKNYEQKLSSITRILNSLSFKETLKRGFSVVSQNGKIIKSSKELLEDNIEIEFYDGKKSIKNK